MSLNDVRFNSKSIFIRDIVYDEDGVTLKLEDSANSVWRFEVKMTEKFLRKTLDIWNDMPV